MGSWFLWKGKFHNCKCDFNSTISISQHVSDFSSNFINSSKFEGECSLKKIIFIPWHMDIFFIHFHKIYIWNDLQQFFETFTIGTWSVTVGTELTLLGILFSISQGIDYDVLNVINYSIYYRLMQFWKKIFVVNVPACDLVVYRAYKYAKMECKQLYIKINVTKLNEFDSDLQLKLSFVHKTSPTDLLVESLTHEYLRVSQVWVVPKFSWKKW